MSASLHPSGLYRAYKKINGKEYQIYRDTQQEADIEQEKLEVKSRLYNSLKGKKVFAKCGRLHGYSIVKERRIGRIPTISWQRQLKIRDGYPCKSRRYYGNFEIFWLEIKRDWAKFNELTPADLADYKHAIKMAKILYMQDVFKLE